MLKRVRSSGFDFGSVLREGDVVTWPQGTGEPRGLTQRLADRGMHWPAVRLFLGMSCSDTFTPEHADRFTFTGLNGAGTNRRLTAGGLLDVIPAHVSAVPGLIRSGVIRVDVVLLRVRPHPRKGFFTVGVICDFTQAMVAAARCVIAEIDERLPMTAQDALIAGADMDLLVDADADEVLLPDPEPDDVEMRVACHVASCIPDGATIQLGIGTLPVAVCRSLTGHRDLGVHSGVIPDAVVDLVERGVITNSRKVADAGRIVTGGLFGGMRLKSFADNNPALNMRSADYTHNGHVMSGIHALHGINSAIEIDLAGQVNSEVAGGRYLGAVGGQVDFVRGAQCSPGGRSILALPSTTPDGKRSRIVATFDGRPVTTSRADVDLVVTEYGVADLRGQSLRERGRRMAVLAHPAFREAILAEFNKFN